MTIGAPPTGSDPVPTLYRWTYRALGLLAVQFVLGMWVNLFGSFPTASTLGGVFLYQGDAPLLVHVTVAALLLGAAVVTLALSFGRRVPVPARVLIALGALGIFTAAVAGYLFVGSGFQDDQYSFSMAMGFLVAMLGYGAALPSLAVAVQRPLPARADPVA